MAVEIGVDKLNVPCYVGCSVRSYGHVRILFGASYRMDCLQRLHGAVAKRMDQFVDATVLEAEAAQWRQISLSTDVDSSPVLPDMRF
jgi:hypothetical protein